MTTACCSKAMRLYRTKQNAWIGAGTLKRDTLPCVHASVPPRGQKPWKFIAVVRWSDGLKSPREFNFHDDSLLMLILFLFCDVVTRLLAGQSWGSIPSCGKTYFSYLKRPDMFWGPPNFLIKGEWIFFSG